MINKTQKEIDGTGKWEIEQCAKSSPENGYDQPAKLRKEILQKQGLCKHKERKNKGKSKP
jgi:hypothetical protein